MSDPIDLKAERDARRLIWVCNCGCTVHRCYADGVIKCAECDSVGRENLGNWRARLPEPPADPEEVGPEAFKVVELDSAATFLRRALKRENVEDIVAAILIERDGSTATYCTDEAAVHPRWLWNELRDAFRRAVRHYSRD